MEIKGKVHCFFEQSGTFKNEFIKLGIAAEDYDIQNNFGQTDHTDDLFKAIEDAYDCKPSLFDSITADDLIIAFFPCIYFCENNELYFTGKHMNLSRLTTNEKIETIIQRSRDRQRMYELCMKLFCVCDVRNIRLIVENPYAQAHYLINNFPYKAVLIDKNRTLRGDFYNKPTQYWFVNCEPTHGNTYQMPSVHKKIASGKPGLKGGICSEDRSMISPEGTLYVISSLVNRNQTFAQHYLTNMRPYKKLAEQRAANKDMTNRGRTKAFVRGFEDAMAYLKEMQDKGLITITFNQ